MVVDYFLQQFKTRKHHKYFKFSQVVSKSHGGTFGEYVPLTNRVRGPYRKLRTEFFPPRFMAQALSARAINRGGKRGSVTYSTDRDNEVSRYLLYLYWASEGLRKDSYSRGTALNF